MGYASELGNYAEYSGAPNEEEVLQYARVVIDVRSSLSLSHFLFFQLDELQPLYVAYSFALYCSVLLRIQMVVKELF